MRATWSEAVLLLARVCVFADVLRMQIVSLRDVFFRSPEAVFASGGLTRHTRFKE